MLLYIVVPVIYEALLYFLPFSLHKINLEINIYGFHFFFNYTLGVQCKGIWSFLSPRPPTASQSYWTLLSFLTSLVILLK